MPRFDPYAINAHLPTRQAPVVVPGGGDQMRTYAPTFRDSLAQMIATGGGYFGMDPYEANKMGRNATGLLEWAPGVGDLTDAADLSTAYEGGDWPGMGIASLGFIPGAGKPLKEAAQKAKKAIDPAVDAGRDAIAKTMKKRPEAITAKSLRDVPPDEAMAIAKSERHLIPKKDGGFVGGPYNAQTMADLEMIRKKFDEDVAAGASGADWYPRAQEWIKSMAGDDPARQSELARNLALFSAQADPKGNLGFSVKARNNAIMGMTPESEDGKKGVVRTGQQWQTYLDAFNSGDDIKLGPKTGVYSDHMDPTRTNPNTGTNDIWHARALGYTTPEGLPWETALTPQQHSFMDAETLLAMDRANTAGIGGRTDWTPGEIQAAPWVTGKGRGLEISRGMSPEEGLAEASKTYPDYAPSFTAYGTHEMAPGATTGHLPNIATGDQQARDAFGQLPGGWWKDPTTNRDILYDAQGAYVGPTADTTGIFNDEFNLGQAATPLISFSGPSGRRVVDPASQQMMTGTEAFRAMMDAQDAGAWSASIPDQRLTHSNAFSVPGPQSRDELAAVLARASNTSMPNVVNQGGGRNLVTNFGAEEPGITPAQKKEMQAAFPGAEPVRREGDYIGYEDAWQAGQGSDQVTKQMLSKLNPAQEKAFSDPKVRQAVLAKFDRDQGLAKQGQQVRPDLQTARKIFAENGIQGLKDALGKGILPAAAMAAFLPYLTSEDGGGA